MASINVTVPQGQNASPDFYVYGLANNGSTTYTVTTSGLNPLTTYYLRVKARNNNGQDTAFLSLGSTQTLVQGVESPSAPDNVMYYSVTENFIGSQWDLRDGNAYRTVISSVSNFVRSIRATRGVLFALM